MTNRKKLVTEMGRIDRDAFSKADKLRLVVVLDNVRSLHNVGSVFRTGDAFRVERIMLCGITATPPSAEIHKTALGAELRKQINKLRKIDVELMNVGEHDHGEIFAQNALCNIENIRTVLGTFGGDVGDDADRVFSRNGDNCFHFENPFLCYS